MTGDEELRSQGTAIICMKIIYPQQWQNWVQGGNIELSAEVLKYLVAEGEYVGDQWSDGGLWNSMNFKGTSDSHICLTYFIRFCENQMKYCMRKHSKSLKKGTKK